LPPPAVTPKPTLPMAVKAMKAGAIEFLLKPCRDQEMLDVLRLGLEQDRARREGKKAIAELRANFTSLTPREEVMGPSPQGS
jgi:FixJ family two-component response regulator